MNPWRAKLEAKRWGGAYGQDLVSLEDALEIVEEVERARYAAQCRLDSTGPQIASLILERDALRAEVEGLRAKLVEANETIRCARHNFAEATGQIDRVTVPCPEGRHGCAVHHFKFFDWRKENESLRSQLATARDDVFREVFAAIDLGEDETDTFVGKRLHELRALKKTTKGGGA